MSTTPKAQEQHPNSVVLLDNIALADGGDETSIVASIGGFRHKVLTIATAGLSSGKSVEIEVRISNQHDVDFESAASETNRWSLVQMKDLYNQDSKNGSITIADSNDSKSLAINADDMRWLAVKATFTGAGQSVTVQLDLFGKHNEDN